MSTSVSLTFSCPADADPLQFHDEARARILGQLPPAAYPSALVEQQHAQAAVWIGVDEQSEPMLRDLLQADMVAARVEATAENLRAVNAGAPDLSFLAARVGAVPGEADLVDRNIAFLRLTLAGWVSLAAIDADGAIESRTFVSAELDKAKPWMLRHIRSSNLYYQLNEPRADLGHHRASKADIERLRGVVVDYDPPAGAESLEQKRSEMLGRINRLPVAPTYVVSSGRGFQLVYLFPDPLPAGEHREAVESQTRGMLAACGTDQSTLDITRLCRLPFGFNFPNAAKRKAGYTGTLQCGLVRYSHRRTALEVLASHIAPIGERGAGAHTVQRDLPDIDMDAVKAVGCYEDLPEALIGRFEGACAADEVLKRLWDGDRAAVTGHDATGSGFAFALAGQLRPRGFTATECGQLLHAWEHSSDPDKMDARYIARAWSKARPSAAEELAPVPVSDAPAPNGWQEPADLWEREQEPPELPAGVVPTYVERFARDRARRLGVNDGAMAATSIVALSSMVPAAVNIQMREHSNHWPNKCILWAALIGDPGTAKSPTLNAAMAFPKAAEAAWRREYARAKDAFDLAQPPKEKPPGRRKRPGQGAAAEAQAEPAAPPADPFEDIDSIPASEPKLRRKIANDATTEALSYLLAENPEMAPALLHCDELAGLIGSLDAYKARAGKDRPFYLSAKDGGAFAVDRKSSGSVLVPSLAVSIVGTIQDDKLAKIAPTLTDDGFLQRFAMVAIKKTGRGEDIPADDRLDGSVERVALALAGLEAQDYRLAPDAIAELNAMQGFAEREADRFDLPPSLKTWLSKTPNEFGRYCLAFHLIEWAASVAPMLGDEPELRIGPEVARRARRYVQEFLYPQARHVYCCVMAKGQDDDDVRGVAGYILAHDVEMATPREICRHHRSLRGSENRAKLRSVMATLAMQDWVKVTGAEPRMRWKVNPAVHDGRFAEIKGAEAARRAAIRGEIAATVDAIRAAREARS